jgi:hypothetical protein
MPDLRPGRQFRRLSQIRAISASKIESGQVHQPTQFDPHPRSLPQYEDSVDHLDREIVVSDKESEGGWSKTV